MLVSEVQHGLAEAGCISCHAREHFDPPAFDGDAHAAARLPLDGETLARPESRMSFHAVRKMESAGAIWVVEDARQDRRYRSEDVIAGRALFEEGAESDGMLFILEGSLSLETRSEGEIGGYHCWSEAWLPETGWWPWHTPMPSGFLENTTATTASAQAPKNSSRVCHASVSKPCWI